MKNIDISGSRREFLKWSSLALGSLIINPKQINYPSKFTPKYVMVGNPKGVSVFKAPNDKSLILYQKQLDEIINVYYDVVSPDGPEYNPLWYRVWGGYVHSANLVEVKFITNPIQSEVKKSGQLAEVTMPYTRTMFYNSIAGWVPTYRFYYGSIHWVIDVITGPDNQPWYKIKDELLEVELAAPAEMFRMISDDEFSPISPEIPPEKKKIEISLYLQTLRAFEGDNVVFETKISSGLPWGGMATPTGRFHVATKMPSKHMGDGQLTSDIYAYELLGVPWNCFFEMELGVATHGTYWHNNFGSQMSHGCVNMRTSDAKWVYRWTNPVATPNDWEKHGYGTIIDVI